MTSTQSLVKSLPPLVLPERNQRQGLQGAATSSSGAASLVSDALRVMSRSKSGIKRPPIDPDALKKVVEAVIASPGNKNSIKEPCSGEYEILVGFISKPMIYYHLFRLMAHFLRGRNFEDFEAVEMGITEFFGSKPEAVIVAGLQTSLKGGSRPWNDFTNSQNCPRVNSRATMQCRVQRGKEYCYELSKYVFCDIAGNIGGVWYLIVWTIATSPGGAGSSKKSADEARSARPVTAATPPNVRVARKKLKRLSANVMSLLSAPDALTHIDVSTQGSDEDDSLISADYDANERLKWAGHVARMGESRNAYRVLVGKPEGKRPLERPRRRWKDDIKMDLREVGYDDRDWINLAQDRDQWRA
ncbi:hypothetical protein ANN_13003 [Periplaneta americana]|uniref:Uncharacterized protein n=1 Tax=Periplaneta americana TaxID=6978 RepID=A0ABQ8TI66_PERAM|nr:hypothetical protein ANN_13003 [Periplaneta americana]